MRYRIVSYQNYPATVAPNHALGNGNGEISVNNLGCEKDEKDEKDKAEKGKGKGFGKDHQCAEICKNNMHDYADICRDVQRYAEMCKSMQRYAEICKDMQRYAEICNGIQTRSKDGNTITGTRAKNSGSRSFIAKLMAFFCLFLPFPFSAFSCMCLPARAKMATASPERDAVLDWIHHWTLPWKKSIDDPLIQAQL